ncbi:hypothetical protein GCM10010464_63480 [Pseudonocardia yunnanensis]
MSSTLLDVAYGYLQIGPLSALSSPDRPANDPLEFASVHNSVIYVQVGTHTGQVELDVTVVRDLQERSFGSAAWEELLYPVEERELRATSFHGLNESFRLFLPQEWVVARVRIVSERYSEAAERSVTGQQVDPLEHVRVEFAPGSE